MIQVKDLRYRYKKEGPEVLQGLDFSIAKGEIFGFLGPSGAGKSTAQKILYKILDGYSGTITIDNKDLRYWGREYHEMIGVGFELPNHYLKLTGKENLEFFGSFYKGRSKYPAKELFEKVDLGHAMNDPVETYSKGMKMRLNFIRAVQHDPEILFFDEPTSGLDPINARTIKELIKELQSEGKTVFITTHHMETADQLCDQVAFIAKGRLMATDPPSKFKEAHGRPMVKARSLDGNTREFPLEAIGRNRDFLDFIQDNPIASLKTQEATLEEVFISITGETLRP
ncbi:ABC transporter ATP-binding protein [Muricauda sp. NFXS6]|uniref:ABC transporter ATP-binding protein n=1 Tax=Allomuricauda sp. NFXS6 TaxID=2819094 RepID=UPI0032DE9C18